MGGGPQASVPPFYPSDTYRNLVFLLLLHQVISHSLSLNNILMTGPKAHLSFAGSVAAGVHASMEECSHQFRWHRWNCPQVDHIFARRQRRGVFTATREVAFVQAMTSAGVVHTLTQNCSLGDIEKCGCDDTRKDQRGGVNWKWGGCSDNIRFGEKISRLFVDGLETGNDARAAVNLHNNEAGRKAVRRTMRLLCKCHGVSGACTTKTCWQQLADLSTVGSFLRQKYTRAFKVDFQNGLIRHATRAADIHRIRKTQLVYLEPSPDYCRRNATLGIEGTVGRHCSAPGGGGEKVGRAEKRSCQELCFSCGLRVRKRVENVSIKCNCKFVWCCEVKCQVCDVTRDVMTCTP